MSAEMHLFDFIEGQVYKVDPPLRTTRVRAHVRQVKPRARATDPSTSHEAASRVAPSSGATEARILAAYEQWGPMTPFECAARMPDALDGTVRSAVGHLRGDGRLVETGVTRPSPSGSPSMVLRLA